LPQNFDVKLALKYNSLPHMYIDIAKIILAHLPTLLVWKFINLTNSTM
jgi:hypothetical protein